MTNVDNTPIAANAKRLLFAGFMAILAAGVGFAIRGGIFDNWGAEFGFTGAQLGAIGGAGFSGFCFGIIIGGVICDKIGYGKLVVAAFALHVLSAFVTFAATAGDGSAGATQLAYNYLFWGMFIFAFANGTLEAVANPLVATLFPNNRTHYLNILHASWPAGLIIGGVLGWVLDDKMKLDWKIQLSLYLIPTILYGLLFFGQRMPKSEASEKGLTLGEMFRDVGVLGGFVVCFLLTIFFQGALQLKSETAYVIGAVLLIVLGVISRQMQKPTLESLAGLAVCALIGLYFQQAFGLSTNAGMIIGLGLLFGLALIMRWPLGSILLFVLFVAHALVGAVELGTDGWIQNITGNILSSEQGKFLFVFTSTLMFLLRFSANFIEKRIGLSPIGILLVCAILACVGLNLASGITTFAGALLALTIYGIGKTFFWPTMLAVASDRFPRTGAIAISIMGGIGMLSAGLIGSPGLGYAKDRFSGEALQHIDSGIHDKFAAKTTSKFLFFGEATGLDGKELGRVQGTLGQARSLLEERGIEKANKDIEVKTKKLDKVKENLAVKRKQLAESLRAAESTIQSLLKAGKNEWDTEVENALEQKAKLEQESKKLEIQEEKQLKATDALSAERKSIEEMKGKLEDLGVLTPGKNDLRGAQAALSSDERALLRASIKGDRKTLKADSFIPAIMALIYLGILLYFKARGGYKPVHLEGTKAAATATEDGKIIT